MMNLSKIVVVCGFVVVLILGAFPQKDDSYREDLMRQDEERQQKQIEEILKRTQNPNFEYLESFLPSGKNSWYIAVTSTGGIMGGSRILSAINSNGNYSCSYGQEFRAQVVPKPQFEPFSEMINKLTFEKLRSDQPRFFGCKDCLSNVLTFHKGNNSFEFQLFDKTVDSEIKQLFDNLTQLAPCL